MSDHEKGSQDFSRLPPSTTIQVAAFAAPEITQQSSGQSVTPDAAIVPIVLVQHGAQVSIPWFTNHLTKQRQCRYVIRDQNLIVDVFQNEREKLKISMHNLSKWVSPSDSLMPRYAKTLAFAISAAGVRCKYQQDALQKYSKGVGDE
jgi:hypothetical protein